MHAWNILISYWINLSLPVWMKLDSLWTSSLTSLHRVQCNVLCVFLWSSTGFHCAKTFLLIFSCIPPHLPPLWPSTQDDYFSFFPLLLVVSLVPPHMVDSSLLPDSFFMGLEFKLQRERDVFVWDQSLSLSSILIVLCFFFPVVLLCVQVSHPTAPWGRCQCK